SPQVRAHKLELARQLIDQLLLLGGDTLVLASNGSDALVRDWAAAVTALRRIGDLAKPRNVRIAFQPLCYTPWTNYYRLSRMPATAMSDLSSTRRTSSCLIHRSTTLRVFPAARSFWSSSTTCRTRGSPFARCCATTACFPARESGRSTRSSTPCSQPAIAATS